ncbi:hypothetical protein A2U01_0058397, partial [Trifolium medium]|nr:hypothetical protein [Trifolium medium]
HREGKDVVVEGEEEDPIIGVLRASFGGALLSSLTGVVSFIHAALTALLLELEAITILGMKTE